MRRALLVLVPILLGGGAAPAPGTVAGHVKVFSGKQEASSDVAFVYLTDKHPHRGPKAKPGKDSVQIVQHNEQFEPRIVVVPTGTTVWFPNHDRVFHNVFSPTDPSFDLGSNSTDAPGPNHGPKEVFLDPSEFDIYCDVHKNMAASVKVVDAPSERIAHVTDGAFQIAGVADGEYTLHAWAPHHSAEVLVDVTVAAGAVNADTAKALDNIHLQLGAATDHTRKDGDRYREYP